MIHDALLKPAKEIAAAGAVVIVVPFACDERAFQLLPNRGMLRMDGAEILVVAARALIAAQRVSENAIELLQSRGLDAKEAHNAITSIVRQLNADAATETSDTIDLEKP